MQNADAPTVSNDIAQQTGLSIDQFPRECPYAIANILSADGLPNAQDDNKTMAE